MACCTMTTASLCLGGLVVKYVAIPVSHGSNWRAYRVLRCFVYWKVSRSLFIMCILSSQMKLKNAVIVAVSCDRLYIHMIHTLPAIR